MLFSSLLRRKLNTIIINKKFQLGFIAHIMVIGVLNFCLLFGAVQMVFWNLHVKAQKQAVSEAAPTSYINTLEQMHSKVNWAFGLIGLVYFAFMLGGGLLLSHRVAGPLYRLRHHMDDIASGKTRSHVRFRKNDFFEELAVSFNRQLDHHQEKGGGSEKLKKVS